MKLYFEKKELLGFFIAVAALAILGVFSYMSTQRLIHTAQVLTHAMRVINNATELMKASVDIQTGQRGYLITGDEEFLKPFYESSKTIGPRLGLLDSLTTNDQNQNAKVDELRGLINRQLIWEKNIIEIRKGSFEKARELVASGEGKKRMDTIRGVVKNLQDEERSFLDKRNVSSKNLKQFQYSFVGLAITIAVVIAYLFYKINANLKERIETKYQLEQMVDKTRDLYENAPCGYHSLNGQGLVVEMNETELRWLGYPREEVINKLTLNDLITEATRHVFEENFLLLKKRGHVNNVALEFKRKDGSSFPSIVSATAIVSPDDNFLMSRSTVFDNTERKEAETDRDNFFNYSHDLLTIISLDGKMMRWNPAWEKILGYTKSDLTGKEIKELIHPDDWQTTYNELTGKLAVGEEVISFENRYRSKTGTYHTLLWNAVPVTKRGLIYGFARDITQRKQAEENLQKNLREIADYKYALDESSIVGITDQKGIIKFANDNFCKISKYSEDELLGQDHRLISSGYHSKEFIRDLWVTVGDGKIWRGDIKNKAKDGTYYWVYTTIIPFLNEQGKPYQYVAIRSEITQRKKAEEQLHLLNQELNAFTYSVSHDLRAPLRSVVGYTEILKEDYGTKLDEEGQRITHIIINNAKRMGRLIDDLLDFSRMGRMELFKANLNMDEMVQQILQELTAAENGRQLELNISPLKTSLADEGMLRQVWVNLISNALKYSQKKEITKIEIGSFYENSNTCYYVSDNGVGFDMKYVDKLFGVFQRLHKASEFEGVGVGLALVKRIIQRHGGTVWAEGKINEGAKFYFTVPNTMSFP